MKPATKVMNTPELTGGQVSNDMWLSGKRSSNKQRSEVKCNFFGQVREVAKPR